MSEVDRRGFLTILGAAITVLAIPKVANGGATKPPTRSKWTDVWVKSDFETRGVKIAAYHRDRSVPIGQRKAYAVGYRISREAAQDMGPDAYKRAIRELKARAIEQVERAAAGLPSEATLKAEGAQIAYSYAIWNWDRGGV